MAKMTRERAVKERRERKQKKREDKKQAEAELHNPDLAHALQSAAPAEQVAAATLPS